jgi:hypothetical protein
LQGSRKGFPALQPDVDSQTQSDCWCESNPVTAVSRRSGSERRASVRRLACVAEGNEKPPLLPHTQFILAEYVPGGCDSGLLVQGGRKRGLLTGPELSTGSEAAASTPVARTRTAASRRVVRCCVCALPTPLQHAQRAAQSDQWKGKRRVCSEGLRRLRRGSARTVPLLIASRSMHRRSPSSVWPSQHDSSPPPHLPRVPAPAKTQHAGWT